MISWPTYNDAVMNKLNFFTRLLLIGGVTLWLTSCSQKTVTVESIDPLPAGNQTEIQPSSDGPSANDRRDYQQGIEALSVRDYDKAESIFIIFVKKHPKLSGAYINLALIAFRQEDYPKADWLNGIAIDLNPGQAYAYNLRAQIHIKKGELQKARRNYLRAIELKPGYANAHYNLALLYDIFLQEIALAIDHYSIYLSLLEKEDKKTRNWVKYLQTTLDNG